MESGMSLKQQQRTEARALRDALPLPYRQQASREIGRRLLALPQVQCGRAFSIYLSTGSEVETDAIVQALLACGKQLYAPRCGKKGEMECYRVERLEDVVQGAYGIREPRTQERLKQPDIILVPALAFAADGQRIGYGGGYYDRYLARFPQAYSIGLCFSKCLRAQVATEPWDCPVSRVLTERS